MKRVSREVLSPLLDVSAISCRAQVGARIWEEDTESLGYSSLSHLCLGRGQFEVGLTQPPKVTDIGPSSFLTPLQFPGALGTDAQGLSLRTTGLRPRRGANRPCARKNGLASVSPSVRNVQHTNTPLLCFHNDLLASY